MIRTHRSLLSSGFALRLLATVLLTAFPLAGFGQNALERMRERLIDSYSEIANPIFAQRHMDALDEQGRFPDLEYTGLEAWQDHLERASLMVQVYYQEVGRLSGDAELYASAVSALDRWLTEDYIDPNWWWTYIGFPKRLVPVTSLIAQDLRDSDPATYTKLIDYHYRVHEYFLRNPHGGGANLADMGYVAAVGAIADGNTTELIDIVNNSFEEVIRYIPYTSNADGVRIDGTIFSHGPQLYNATYGREFLNSSILGIALFKDTPWDQGVEAERFIEDQLLNGIRAMSYGDWMDYNTMGRAISRKNSHQIANGFVNIIELLLTLDPAHPEELQHLRERIKNDNAATHPQGHGVHEFYYGDYLTWVTEDFYTSIRMISERTSYNESGNGEGLYNAHFGDGINLTLVHGDEYDKMSVLWDYEKLPGLTAENNGTVTRLNSWADYGEAAYAGSAATDSLAVSAMRLDHDGVTGWKSWFVLPDGVVALGSGINAPRSNQPVLTTINETIYADALRYGFGTEEVGTVESGENVTLNGTAWVWHRDIGYVLLDREGSVKVEAEFRSGDWSEIGTGSGRVEGDVMSLYFDHEIRPQNAGYAYMTLPAADVDRTKAAAADNPMEILRRDGQVHAVKMNNDGTVLAAFLQGGQKVSLTEQVDLGASEPVLAIVRKVAGHYHLTVSDPRHELDAVSLTLDGRLEGPGAAYDDTEDTTTLSFVLPDGDETGSSMTRKYRDLDDPDSSWGAYFDDVRFNNAEKDFLSDRFGWWNAATWPWVWSFTYQKFWYMPVSARGPGVMFWFDPADGAWLYTSSYIFPWHFHYGIGRWGRFGTDAASS